MAKVKVDLESVPQGQKLEVPYLGVVENGSTKEVTDAQWERYKRYWPGAEGVEGDTLEITTKSAADATKAAAELRASVRAEQGRAGSPPTPVAQVEGRESRGQGFIAPQALTEDAAAEGVRTQEEKATPLSDKKKSELVELATARGDSEANSKTKDELVEQLSQEG